MANGALRVRWFLWHRYGNCEEREDGGVGTEYKDGKLCVLDFGLNCSGGALKFGIWL